MKPFAKLYKFLGSIRFAIILIASAAFFVIFGTFIESRTESHLYAARFTYSNPLFIALLWGFFINILVSALHRWPFRLHHIPFLITHLGLLMLLGGAILKSYLGTQGSMGITEGTGNERIFVPDTYVVHVEKKDPKFPSKTITKNYPLQKSMWKGFHSNIQLDEKFNELQINLLEYASHSHERFETWIKGNKAVISGFIPFSANDWQDSNINSDILQASGRIRLHSSSSQLWNVLAGHTQNIAEIAEKGYLQGLQIIVKDTISEEVLFQGLLSDALKTGLDITHGKIALKLHFNYSPLLGFEDPKLIANITKGQNSQDISIALQGSQSLINKNISTPYLGKLPISIDLQRDPALMILQDPYGDCFMFAYDPCGQVFADSFSGSNQSALIVYDQGFAGYTVQTKIPFDEKSATRIEREQAHLDFLAANLKESLKKNPEISAPLKLLQNACNKIDADFISSCLKFLSWWNATNGWLYPEKIALPDNLIPLLENLDWNSISIKDRNGLYWIDTFFADFEHHLDTGLDPLKILQDKGWPLIQQLQKLIQTPACCLPEDNAKILTGLTQQVYLVADQFPSITDDKFLNLSASRNARLLSAYFRAYGIHLSSILTPEIQEQMAAFEGEDSIKTTTLECPLTTHHINKLPQNKVEDNLPKITLRVQKGSKAELITLTYDRYGQGLKWPVLNGEYLIRFQPEFRKIPYRIRLRHARQINYPHSTQPYSYESDLIITDIGLGDVLEKTISMNNVHETWDGYRFYLANIAPPHDSAVKRIQLIVNHDPAKYLLTYPGAIILTLGILLLFWGRKKIIL